MPFPDDRADPVVSPRLGAGRLPALRDAPPLLDPQTEPVPVPRRLPPHRGKLERITDHLAGLNEELREWVELRVQLVKQEVMEQVEGRLTSMKGQAIVGALLAMAGLWFLVFLALLVAWGLTAAGLSHPLANALGFLFLVLLFAVAAAVAKKKLAPGPIRVEHDKETGKVRVAMEESPADHERRKAAEEGREPDEKKTGKAGASTSRRPS